MPYAICNYKSSCIGYTFFTSKMYLKANENVLVADSQGFSIVTFIKYTEKPEFKTSNIIMSENQMKFWNKISKNRKKELKGE